MLNRLITDIKNYEGLTRKKDISQIIQLEKALKNTYGAYGDDAAVLPWGDQILLFASDGIWSRLSSDPFWAGYCSVLVNVNDIYAMGGVPLAMVNVISMNQKDAPELLEGIKTGCQKFQVPVVGGHVHPCTDTSIAVAIVGKAQKVLTSFDASPGEKIVLALDLDGKQYKNFLNWDSTSSKSSEQVVNRLEALPLIGEKELATACKDVSNPGILGTIGMLLETSRLGAEVYVEHIQIPDPLDINTFVKMYPGYGFVLTVEEPNVKKVIDVFEEKHISATVIGETTSERKMILHYHNESKILFDFEKEIICGF